MVGWETETLPLSLILGKETTTWRDSWPWPPRVNSSHNSKCSLSCSRKKSLGTPHRRRQQESDSNRLRMDGSIQLWGSNWIFEKRLMIRAQQFWHTAIKLQGNTAWWGISLSKEQKPSACRWSRGRGFRKRKKISRSNLRWHCFQLIQLFKKEQTFDKSFLVSEM